MTSKSMSGSVASRHPSALARRSWVLLAILIVGSTIGGLLSWNRGHPATRAEEVDPAKDEPATAEGTRVAVVHPEPGGLTRTSSQIGSVHPFEQADLFAKVSGYLKKQQVDIGSRVKKGELLAEIDDPEIVKEADRAAASVAQAKSAVAQARARVETAQADVKAAQAAVTKAEASIGSYVSRRKYREKELARYRDLRSRQAVPQQVVDEYEDHYETAVSELRSAEAELASSKALLVSAQAKVEQAKADLLVAESNVAVDQQVLARDRVLVDYTKITSPYDGVVTRRNFFVGDFIRSAAEGNERPMLTVAREDKMRVVTYVPDRDVPFTDIGDKAFVTLDALPGRRFEGTVSRFSSTEEPQSRTMRTEIDLDNSEGLLREGMYGVASIVLGRDNSSLTIPSGCLVGKAENGKSSVFVVRAGHARSVPVTVGADNGIRVEVLKGLSQADEVIVNKAAVTKDTPVIVEQAAASANQTEPAGHSR